jgi:hypothetical protein
MSEQTEIVKNLGEVKGQLTAMQQLMMANHQSTNQRIDDLKESINTRLNGHEGRIGTLEKNERSTAIKAGTAGALAGALAAATIAGVKAAFGIDKG